MQPVKNLQEIVQGKVLATCWSSEQEVRCKAPTSTRYASVPIETLRGINPLFDALCDLVAGVDGAWIAGGAIESLVRLGPVASIKDFDLFFSGPAAFWSVVDRMASSTNHPLLGGYAVGRGWDGLDDPQQRWVEFAPAGQSSRPRNVVQLIKTSWFASPEQVLDSFDFTACQFATDGRVLVFNPQAPVDVSMRRLMLARPSTPETLEFRVKQYKAKGYHVDTSIPSFMERFLEGGGVFEDASSHSGDDDEEEDLD